MRTTLSRTILALLVCACVASDLSSIASRTSAIQVPDQKVTVDVFPIQDSSIVPSAKIELGAKTAELRIEFPQPIQPARLEVQPQTSPAPPVEEKKAEVSPLSVLPKSISFRIFDILSRPKGAAASTSSCQKRGEEAFQHLIRALALQKLVDEKDFANIKDLDDKAKLALVEKLSAALKKLQELVKAFRAKLSNAGAKCGCSTCFGDPVYLVQQLLNRARAILEQRTNQPTACVAQQSQTSAPRFVCPYQAKRAAAAKAAAEAAAKVAAPAVVPAVNPAAAVSIQGSYKPEKVESGLAGDFGVKSSSITVTLPTFSQAAPMQIDSSKFARRLKGLKGL